MQLHRRSQLLLALTPLLLIGLVAVLVALRVAAPSFEATRGLPAGKPIVTVPGPGPSFVADAVLALHANAARRR